jgi:outer membrane receptor protein involved in Fe transport
MLRSRVAGVAGSVLVFFASAGAFPALAQDESDVPSRPDEVTVPEAAPDAPEVPAIEPPSGIEAIEVTGERLNDADVQDEAQAITAFTGADLDRANIVSVDSLAFNVPGLHVGQSAQAPIITLRGIGTENASLTGEPGVAFHVDGLNLSRPAAARVAFFDLETLDVKRGPQGLLGGKNSTSGSINLTTRKPSDEYEIEGDVLFGNYDRQRFRGAINVPLGEFVATRVALYSEQRDGFLDNKLVSDSRDPFDADDLGGRAHIKLTPSDTLQVLFSYNYFRQDGNGPQADPVPIGKDIWPQSLQEFTLPDGTVLTRGPNGEPPPGYREGCKFGTVPFSTVLPLASACFDTHLFRDQLTNPDGTARAFSGLVSMVDPGLVFENPGSVQVVETMPDGARVVRGRAIRLPNGRIRVAPSTPGLAGSRIVRDRRNTGVPGQTTPFTYGGRPGEGDASYNAARDETTFGEVRYWNPATEDSDPRSIYATPASQRNRYWGWGTGLDWDAPALPVFGETHVKLLGGFQRTEGGTRQDFDATEAELSFYTADDTADQYNAELLWSGTGLTERLEWQTSLFHSHEKAERDVSAPGLNGNELGSLTSEQTTDNKAYGAALHGKMALTDALAFSLGGRWIKDKKSTWLLRDAPGDPSDGTFRGCTGNLNNLGSPRRPGRANDSCSDEFRGTMWGAGLEWRPFGDNHLLYSKIDRGYKSGGFRASTVGGYDPERIWAYAAGTKSEFFDQRLRLNLEGFFYNYQDLQLVILDGFSLRTENADARMYGWDLEAMASPMEGLNLSAVISFLKTETGDYLSLDPTTEPPPGTPLNDFNGYFQWHEARLKGREQADAYEAEGVAGAIPYSEIPTCLQSPTNNNTVKCGTLPMVGGLDDFTGYELSRSPKWKATFSAEYEFPLGRFGALTPRVQYTWQDDTYFRVFNRGFDLQEDYHLTDVKLIWTSPEDRWAVEAFVQNIEDDAPKQNILIGPRQFGSPPLSWYGPPRFYGVQVGFKY